MIRYALKCAEGHSFESWFQSADAFDALADKGLVACSVCGGSDVTKALMAPRVVADSPAAKMPAPVDAPAPVATPPKSGPLSGPPAHPMEKVLRALRDHVENNSTHVGQNFASEARAMHLGEKRERPIHGEANGAEVKSLLEDGVPVMPLPILPKNRTN